MAGEKDKRLIAALRMSTRTISPMSNPHTRVGLLKRKFSKAGLLATNIAVNPVIANAPAIQ